MTFHSQHKPMDTIKDWQIWYKQHQPVAEMDEPLASKDSRENMHDTSNATNHEVEKWRNWIQPTKQIQESYYFNSVVDALTDVLAEYTHELTPEEFHRAFLFAAVKAMNEEEEEYKKAKKLVDLLSSINLVTNNDK